MDFHQNKEASLQDKLHKTQKELKNAVDMHAGRAAFGSILYICISSPFLSLYFVSGFSEVVLRLRQSQERGTMKETEAEERYEALMKEKNELLELSMQRGKIIQASYILNNK